MADWLELTQNWWQSWHFAAPQLLWLGAFLPVWWLWRGLVSKRDLQDDLGDWRDWHFSRIISAKHSLLAQMQANSLPAEVAKEGEKQLKTWQALLLFTLRFALLLSLLFVLAQPQKALPPEPLVQQKTVRDLLFVVEASASFLLNDYQQDGKPQTRMQAVQQVLDQFIEQLPGNRFAITVYAQSAFNLLPLSADQQAARLYLQRLRPYLAGRTDEAMAEALGLALKQTQSANLALEQMPERKRVLILISDGDNQPSRLPVEQALDYAQLLQVPIYTIGVGATDERADKREFSGLLYQPLKADLLRTIAAQSGGQFYQIGSGLDLREVLHKIDQAEGVPWQAPPKKRAFMPLYPQFLWLSLLLFVAYLSVLVLTRSASHDEEGAR
ncbi:vWA domain-containing protein [Thiomicrorhabdus xiamenensis]|uniref:VWA domain-containing protein n=1 Tax=Thiomicrorhabdus xiamenensis TaxID=2739063 RepID=A0A7D4NJF0_9GAMM|nr:VWA domain-containing protein [Thiomicrorhabdus xiamenensis]QKI88169.1 VWA domain-containing protein [Thiomicrorhabdus xiamenensis]